MKTCIRTSVAGIGAALVIALVAGCKKAPEAPTQTTASDVQLTDSRITSIQNDRSMTPAQKQQAIATLKSRQQSNSAPAPR